MPAQITNVCLREDHLAVRILDQTLLPGQVRFEELQSKEQMHAAIRELKVRGAPAIGIAAGYCLYVLAVQLQHLPSAEFRAELERCAAYLNSSRPTAVNLSWALARLLRVADEHPLLSPAQLLPLLHKEAVAIQQEDAAMCLSIAQHGLSLLKPGMGIITHCNAGPLATSSYGTALGPILLAQEQGLTPRVFADETRPLLQGARITCFELMQAGVDVTLICDNMASQVMKNGWVQACFVGCDRVAMNGDAANKIGTSGLAILAAHYGIPFYVLGPSSTIDPACASGADIEIELRDAQEISHKFFSRPVAPEGVQAFNPAFDVTEAALISGIITEKGILRPPYSESLAALFST